MSRHTVRVNCLSDVGVASSDTSELLLPVSLSVDSSTGMELSVCA